jgi:hypothetical protein
MRPKFVVCSPPFEIRRVDSDTPKLRPLDRGVDVPPELVQPAAQRPPAVVSSDSTTNGGRRAGTPPTQTPNRKAQP